MVGHSDVEFVTDGGTVNFVGIFEALSPAYLPSPESEGP